MQICKLQKRQLREAVELVKEVFDLSLAEEYGEQGVKTFYHFIQIKHIEEMVQKGEMKFWAAFEGNQMAGVIALRGNQHISLLFVKNQYRRKGIAGKLVSVLIAACTEMNLEKKAVTVNASPYAVEVYKHMGFVSLTEEQKKDGIRYTPMLYRL